MSQFFIPKKNTTDHWYKEPWMLLVLGGPLIVVIASLVTFYLAWHGKDEVVSKNYYQQGLKIDKDIQRDIKAAEYAMVANVKIDSSAGKVLLQLEGKTTLPTSVLMTLSAYSSGAEYEAMQEITLIRIKPGEYEGSIKIPSPTDTVSLKLWHVKIETPDWRLLADWREPLHNSLKLIP